MIPFVHYREYMRYSQPPRAQIIRCDCFLLTVAGLIGPVANDDGGQSWTV